MMMSSHGGSPFWQAGLLFFAFVFLLFQAWRGWRAGFVRAGTSLAALVISGIFGWLAFQVASIWLGGRHTAQGFIGGMVVGSVVVVILYLLIFIVGAVLFKRTEHQSSGVLRLVWGAGGALVGVLVGLIVLWGGITLIRGMGALAEGKKEAARAHDQAAPKVSSGLVTLKDSLELGTVGHFFESVDAVPGGAYETIKKISRLSSDKDAMLRFIQYPGIQEVINHPRIIALLDNPSVAASAQKGNFLGLMTNPAFMEAVKDPDLTARIEKIDLAAALDYALQSPEKRAP